MVPLPPELLNRIFDFVELSASRHVGLPDSLDISDDITSDTLPTTRTRTHDLKTCRLVSKQWEQLVLPRLFSRLFILGASHYYSFMDLITGCTTVPLMMLHIKKLWFHTWVDSTGGTPDNALLDIITLLPALQFLQLSFVDKDDQSVPASTRERYAELASKDRFAPTGSNHTRLMLDKLSLSLTDPNPRHLTKLGSVLQRFSSIGTLTLRSMTIESIAVLRFISGTLDTPDANLPPEVVIGELQVRETPIEGVQQFFVTYPYLRYPRSLSLVFNPSAPGLLELAGFLAAFGTPLRGLTLETRLSSQFQDIVEDSRSYQDALQALCSAFRTQMPHLHCIKFVAHTLRRTDTHGPRLLRVFLAIAGATLSLAHLTLQVSIVHAEFWRDLAVLCDAHEHLKSVTVVYGRRYKEELMKRTLDSRRLEQRGILHFVALGKLGPSCTETGCRISPY